MTSPGAQFRNPRGVAAALIVGAALWTCICAALVLALTSCAPVVTISPARIVCQIDGAVVWDYAVDSATVTNGAITSIAIGGQSAAFTVPDGATCEAR